MQLAPVAPVSPAPTTASAAAPEVVPAFASAVDKYIGQRAIRADFGIYGKHDILVGGVGGAREGYETLAEAVDAGSRIAASSFKLVDEARKLVGESFVVVEGAGRYGLLSTHALLAMRVNGNNYGPRDYKSFKGGVGDAVLAVVDGAGHIVRNAGRVGLG